MRLLLVTVFTLSLCVGGATAGPCVPYETTAVTVTGTIFVRTDFGPPGYGEDPRTDTRERHIYITLDKALCTEASAEADGEQDVRTMQMVYFIKEAYQNRWTGRRVAVTGTLFHAHTGHHWTKVLIIAHATRELQAP